MGNQCIWKPFLVLCLLWQGAVVAAPGIVFQITREGVPPSYLLGTIHVDDPRVATVVPRVRPLLRNSRLLMLELVPDGPTMLRVLQASMLPPDQKLSDLLDAALYADVLQLALDRGMPEFTVQRLRPWTVATTLSLPPEAGGNALDLQLYQLAQELGVEVVGLERVEEQIAVFDRLSASQQIALLSHAVKESAQLPQMYADMVSAFVAGDMDRLERLGRGEMARLPASLDRWFGDVLLNDRNRVMLDRMLPELAHGGVVIAIGALHLPGRTGLVAGVRAAGYQVQLRQ